MGRTMATQTKRWLFTVDEYYAMAEAGILSPGDRVELLYGEIIAMDPISSTHASCVTRLTYLMLEKVEEQAIVRVQNPVRLNSVSEPQPDVALLRPRADSYSSSHPGPGDVLLLIEVADTTADLDRECKLPLYARAGIVEYWIVDLTERVVEVYTDPSGTGYGSRKVVGTDGKVSPGTFGDISLPVRQIIPGQNP